MDILKPAIAGTLESSDCMVTVEPGEGCLKLELESAVINQFGKQIKKVVCDTLSNLDVSNVNIKVIDKGALDCTIKARVECAVFRSLDKNENLPWGGGIR